MRLTKCPICGGQLQMLQVRQEHYDLEAIETSRAGPPEPKGESGARDGDCLEVRYHCEHDHSWEDMWQALFSPAPPDLSKFRVGLFDVAGRWEIQRLDETAPDRFTDADALRAVATAAQQGDLNALQALYLDGRPVEDERNFWQDVVATDSAALREPAGAQAEDGLVREIGLILQPALGRGAMSEAEYVRRKGEFCPVCRSPNLEPVLETLQLDAAGASRQVICNDCAAAWDNIYVLEKYANLDLPNRGAHNHADL